MRRFRSVFVGVVGVVVASACEPEADGSAGRVDPETATTSVTPIVEQQTTQVEQAITTVTVVNAVANTVEPRLVDRCVEYVEFQAYVGDADALALWDRVGQSHEGLRRGCLNLDEAILQEVNDEMDRVEAEVAATPQIVATPPPAPSGGCDPNYTPCVPIAFDVDCAGGSGNGPAYVRGPVQIVGSDTYGLDRDGNGVGCE